MTSARTSGAQIVVVLLFVFGLSVLLLTVRRAWSQDIAGRVEPFLRLEKQKYVLGESILFWVGVNTKRSSTIREELKSPCLLSINKPDGATEIQSVGLNLPDLVEASSSSGGWGLGDAGVQTGTYILVLQCANEKTKPVELVVERNGIVDQMKADFRFERSGAIIIGTSVPVILSVQNNSKHRIRFPQRGSMSQGIGIEVHREDPAMSLQSFYPWEKLAPVTSIPDTYSWDSAPDVASITLGPGERFEQRFMLEDAFAFDRPGNYEVTFNTLLEILVGEKGGPFADYCPIRLAVIGEASFSAAN
jgi:hypothetical protein